MVVIPWRRSSHSGAPWQQQPPVFSRNEALDVLDGSSGKEEAVRALLVLRKKELGAPAAGGAQTAPLLFGSTLF